MSVEARIDTGARPATATNAAAANAPTSNVPAANASGTPRQ
jgi:hypothetical protein